MSYQTLILERRGPVGWLILNRPASLNAHNVTMLTELPQAWHELDADDDVRVIVMTGRGKGFCAGADVKEVAASGGGMADRMRSINDGRAPSRASARSNDIWKPVIAAVNGVCAGSGLYHVAEADIAIASRSAFFVDNHVSVGQAAALEPIGLMNSMPLGAVLRMALVGAHERLSADDAFRLGFVSEVVDPPERLDEVAQDLAEKIARNSPAALRHTKQAIWGALETGWSDAMLRGWDHIVQMWRHPDNAEGPKAFAEKRPARWAPPSYTEPTQERAN